MEEKSKAYGYIVLVILMLGTAILYYSNLIFVVRGDTLAVFNMDAVQLSAISTIGIIPGALLSILVGNILDKKGIKWFVAGALALTVVCMAARIFMTTYVGLLVTTILIGVFLLPIMIAGPKMMGMLFEPEDIPFAIGCFGSAGGVGTTLAFATGPVYSTVQNALAGVAAVGAVILILWLVFVKNDPKHPAGRNVAGASPNAPAGGELGRVLKSSNLWKTMICAGLSVGAALIVNTSLTYGFLEKGMDLKFASTLGITLNICLILGGIISGAIIGKIGKFNGAYLFMCIAGGALYLMSWMVPAGSVSFVLIALAGLIASATVGLNFTRLPLLPMTGQFGADSVGAASGMLQTALGVFAFVIPTVATVVATDANDSVNYTLKFIVVLVLLVVAGIISMSIPELGVKGKLAKECAKQREGVKIP
jgi:NNP family nitrate/nitrite transporter-like MFS transporter